MHLSEAFGRNGFDVTVKTGSLYFIFILFLMCLFFRGSARGEVKMHALTNAHFY